MPGCPVVTPAWWRRQALLGLLLLADCPCCCPVVGELSLGLLMSLSWLFFLSQVITDLCLSLVVLLTWDSFPGCRVNALPRLYPVAIGYGFQNARSGLTCTQEAGHLPPSPDLASQATVCCISLFFRLICPLLLVLIDNDQQREILPHHSIMFTSEGYPKMSLGLSLYECMENTDV